MFTLGTNQNEILKRQQDTIQKFDDENICHISFLNLDQNLWNNTVQRKDLRKATNMSFIEEQFQQRDQIDIHEENKAALSYKMEIISNQIITLNEKLSKFLETKDDSESTRSSGQNLSHPLLKDRIFKEKFFKEFQNLMFNFAYLKIQMKFLKKQYEINQNPSIQIETSMKSKNSDSQNLSPLYLNIQNYNSFQSFDIDSQNSQANDHMEIIQQASQRVLTE